MAGLPRRLQIELCNRRLAVIHGGGRQINRFIFRSTPLSVKRQELAWLGCDGVIAGHCGLPFTQLVSGRLWHNAGAIGMPANDGTPRTWYSILRPTAEGILVEPGALAYAAEVASAKMRARGLTAGYDATLLSGIWPSSDVLPSSERGQQGRPLAPCPVHWRCASEAQKAAPTPYSGFRSS
jgi:hypothetical protein